MQCHREAVLEPSIVREYSRQEVKEAIRRRVGNLVRRMADDRGYVLREQDRPKVTE